MSRERLLEAARRTIAHAKAGSAPQVDTIFRVPADSYLDPDRWGREVDLVFRRFPLLFGFSCEFTEEYSYRSMEILGVPVLVSRSGDGELRAFVNTCSHRGAIVVAEPEGSARRFTCPYHGWSYDSSGELVGVFDNDAFGELDKGCHGLTQLPLLESAGLVFVGLNHQGTGELDRYLCGYDEMLEHLGLGDCRFVGRQAVEGPNWKVAYDGYLDFYHLPVLHRESFGTNICNKAIYDAWGPHQRVSAPDSSMLRLEGRPESEWSSKALTTGVWTIFPHVSIASFEVDSSIIGDGSGSLGRMYMVSQLFPGETPQSSLTIQNFLIDFSVNSEVQASSVDAYKRFLLGVVRDEDYATGFGVQRGLATGAKDSVLFGRNEAGGQRFHQWVDQLLETTPESEVLALIENAGYQSQS
ncbi:MAG: hypothetical protein CL460_06460 [Acidimicrobiaceae bacterium]|nr:hypothetical protein [Acidimicrobiaceae bacterium]